MKENIYKSRDISCIPSVSIQISKHDNLPLFIKLMTSWWKSEHAHKARVYSVPTSSGVQFGNKRQQAWFF